MPRVYIIILNWNGWKDTIECLESVFRSSYQNYRVIVCDNNSQDNSIEQIKAWADDQLNLFVPEDNIAKPLSFPPVNKPISFVEYSRTEAESGGSANDGASRLILIKTGANLGFASGNNVGGRYALARDDFDYLWFLNNDTVIKEDTLHCLVEMMQAKPDAGICGSTLVYYDDLQTIQALGGAVYNKWLGVASHIGILRRVDNEPIDKKTVMRQMDYVVGASMFVSKQFIKNVGLMGEDYFLYFEEMDWAMRAREQYQLAYASRSVVFHKEGSSIGTSPHPDKRNPMADFYKVRSSLIFTRKYYWYCLPTVYLGIIIMLFNRAIRAQWKNFMAICKAIAGR